MATQHVDQQYVHLRQHGRLGPERARQRRRVAPLACSSVAVRLRQGVPSRRKRRSVVTTRIVSVGGWPGPRSGGRSQASMTVAMRCRSLKSNTVVPVCCAQIWGAAARDRQSGQINPRCSM